MTNHTLEAVTLALSEGRKTDVLPQLNLYWKNLGKPQVRSLDDIETEHANKGVSSILNIPKGTPQKLREALSRAGVLPTEMGHYTGGEREYVAERILTRLSTPGVRSHYFWHVDEATLKENQQHLAKTAAFKRFLKDNGIETLDDIAGDSFPNAFTILFGISHHGARKLRKKLAEYGAFSICLEDYTPEQLESVVRRIVETKFRGKNKNVNSFYFFDVSDPDTLEKNRACFVRTASFQEYLTTAGIVSPLDITEAVTESEGIDCLTTIVGCKVGSQQGLRKRLVELGTISDRLETYKREDLERIAKQIIEIMPKKKQDSFFFQNRDENVIKQNRRAFAQSDALKEYFMQRGVNTLEDLESLHATAGLGTIFGFKSHSKIEMARQLAAYGTFSNKIATYTRNQQEEIAQKIIKGLQWGNFSSCFFTDIDPTVEQENREALLKTHAVQQFFVREGIDLYNITGTVQTERGRRFMQRYFSGITPRKAEYRKIVTQWTNVEEAGLRFLAGWYGTPDQIIDSVHAHKEWYQEHHGRTVAAILQKMQHMGLLPLPQSGPSRQNGKVAYPFPQIHVEEYPDTPLEFRNLSYMFGQGVIPNHVAVLGYDSASHTQFSHATVPVVYRGVDFSKYNAAEQEALCMIAMYLADRDTFGKEPNGDLKEKHTIVKGHPQPAIIQLKMDDGTKYCQLIFRRRFNPGSCTQTEALITHNATYLHLKHDGPVSFAGTRE